MARRKPELQFCRREAEKGKIRLSLRKWIREAAAAGTGNRERFFQPIAKKSHGPGSPHLGADLYSATTAVPLAVTISIPLLAPRTS